MAATQKNKEIGIATPLAEDALLLKTATISEQLGRLFQIEATLLSQDPAIKLDSLVGENVTIRLNLEAAGEQRFFNGFVSRIVQSRDESNFAKYTATIVPWCGF